MSNENNAKDDESFSSLFFKGSVYVLTLGFLFTLGESLSLSYTYLNTFTYADFLIKAVLIFPFLFISLFLFAGIKTFVLVPIESFLSVLKVAKNDGREKKTIFLSVVNAVTWFLLSVCSIVLVISPFIFSQKELKPYLLLFISIIVLAFVQSKTKQYSIRGKVKYFSEIKTNLNDIFELHIYIFMGFLAFASGYAHIKLQNSKEPNATIFLKSSQKEMIVNIVTSNSNVLALYRNDFLEIIPRNEVQIIRYNKKPIAKVK